MSIIQQNQDLINITSWKRYWGKWLVKKIPTDTSKRDRVPFMRNQGDPLKFHSRDVFHVSSVRYLPIQAWQENWCEKITACTLGGDSIISLTINERLTKETNCKVLWKLVQINLSSLRVIGTCSRLNTLHVHLNSVCVYIHALVLHTHPIMFFRLTGGKCHMALRHPHSEDFHFPRQTSLILGKYRHLQANRYFWDWRKCFRQDWTYRRWVGLFLAWLSSQGFSLQGHSSFRIHSLVFVLTLLSEMLLIHSQYL